MANYKNAIYVMKKMFNIDSFIDLCSEDSISLSELLSLRCTVNCNGECPDFYYSEWDEIDPCGPTIGAHEWAEADFEQRKKWENGNNVYHREYYDRFTNTNLD